MKKSLLIISTCCLLAFIASSCGPDDEPMVNNKYSGTEIEHGDHGDVFITIRCTDPVGPACSNAATSVLTDAQRSSFNTLKEYYYADDVPGFILNEEWQPILPDIDPVITEKLINREYTLKLWNPEPDIVTIIVQKEAGDDFSPENVAYAFKTYRE